MRVVFFGTPEFAVPSLSALVEAGIDVAAVVTQPDRPGARSHSQLVAPPVKSMALARDIPVWQPERPRGEPFLQQLRELRADLGVVVAYGHVLRPDLLAIPRLGLVNVHASLLPRWRGAAPVHWALLAGDRETGVSIMRIEPGLDTGAVWQAQRIAIRDDDTTGSLADRLSRQGAAALLDTLPRIAGGEVPVPQPDRDVTHAPKIDRDTARLRWNEPDIAVSSRIRAMDPAPGAWSTIDGAEIKLFGAAVTRLDSGAGGGTILPIGGRLIVATNGGAVEITTVQPAGRRRLAAEEWLRGAHLPAGSRFV